MAKIVSLTAVVLSLGLAVAPSLAFAASGGASAGGAAGGMGGSAGAAAGVGSGSVGAGARATQGSTFQTPSSPTTGTGNAIGGNGMQTTLAPDGTSGIAQPNGNGTTTITNSNGNITSVPTPK